MKEKYTTPRIPKELGDVGKSILGKKVHVGIKGAFQNEGQEFMCNWSPRCTAPKTAGQLLVTRKSGKVLTLEQGRGGESETREKRREGFTGQAGGICSAVENRDYVKQQHTMPTREAKRERE